MVHEEFFVSAKFNEWIANPIAEWLGFHPHQQVLPAHVVMVILICLGLVSFSLFLRRRLSVENPGGLQQSLELLTEGILALTRDMVGHRPRLYLPLLGSLFVYILSGNLIGLIPGFMSPTSNINITASCAVIVFFYYNFVGIRAHGFWKYMAHFAGPSLVIAPLLFVIEIISHLARPFSLSVRLFGNIYAEELILGNLNSLFPFVISLPVMGLALFASTIQAFIFIVLTMVYLGGAVEHSHDNEIPNSSDAGERGH